jgi:hypothetical protein
MTDPGLPLTTGEGNTALWDEPPNAQITPEQAHEVAANWKDTTQLSNALDAMAYECGRLREQLNTRQWWLDMQYLLADRNRLREQLDAARQALEALWDAAEPYATYRDGDLNAALHAAHAALGVEINDGKDEDDE